MQKNNSFLKVTGTLFVLLLVGQFIAYVSAPASWQEFNQRLPIILAMVGFWGPICAIFSAGLVYTVLRLLGFSNLEEIRKESVEQNNPTPAILFAGTLIASVLFLLLVIRP